MFLSVNTHIYLSASTDLDIQIIKKNISKLQYKHLGTLLSKMLWPSAAIINAVKMW